MDTALTKNKKRAQHVRARMAERGESFTAAMFAAALRHDEPVGAPAPRQLPDDVHHFVGRAGELEQLTSAEAGVLLVAGPAGVGKTALATRLAHRILERFPDGQLFINLRGYDSGPPLGAPAALARILWALGLAPQEIPADLRERTLLYRSRLAGLRMLVVLDNAAAPEQVQPLMPDTPACLTVITSRSRLPQLTSRGGIHRLDLGLLSEPQAQAMLSATTAAYRHGDDPAQVAELARLCAGLPLAVRIAAERAGARPGTALPDLISELRAESALWDALSSQPGERPEAVRAAFSWTYRALPADAAHLLRRLALHPGPHLGIPAAAAVSGQNLETTRDALELLVGAHLLEPAGQGRYQFHDLLRAHALGQASTEESDSERRAALERLALWYLRSADGAARTVQSVFAPVLGEFAGQTPAPATFNDRDEALRWYRLEQPNLLAVVRAVAAAGLDRIAWQLPVALLGIHVAVNTLQDWLEMSEIAVQAARRLKDPRAEALCLESLGIAAKAAGQLQRAAEHHRSARDLFHAAGDHLGAAYCAHSLALVHLQQRDLLRARAGFEASLAAARRHRDGAREAAALCCLAYTAADLGGLQEAADLAEQSLTVHAASGADLYLRVDPLLLLARIRREQGRLAQAAAIIERCDTAAAGLGNSALTRAVLLERAELARARDKNARALELYWAYANTRRSGGDRPQHAIALDGVGRALRALGRLPEAVEAHHGAVELSRAAGQSWQSALALVHLAEVLAQTDQPERADAAGTEALALLANFRDPHAERLRTRLRAMLPNAES
jgi:tetratricopeptide (TPR) repeat protein